MNVNVKLLLVVGLAFSPLVLPPTSVVGAFKYLQEGMTAPKVSGRDLLSGEVVSADPKTEDEREIVCVVFWASWSPRSLELINDLNSLCARLSGNPFRVVAVNVDSQVTNSAVVERVRRIVVDLALTFPVILDDKLEIFYKFGVMAVPSVAILDAEGVVRAAPSGYSYTIRDRLTDTVEIMLGLRTPPEKLIVERQYRPDPTASRYYHLAVQLANQRVYEAALSNVDLAVNADTLFSAPYNLRGHIRLQLGELRAAVKDFERAVALDSSSVSAWAGLGRALLEIGDLKAAQNQLEKALALDASYPVALVDLARCLAAGGDPDSAIAKLKEAIELNSRDPQLYYHLGRVYRERGYLKEAANAYKTALGMIFPTP